jgi:hypothetical protein
MADHPVKVPPELVKEWMAELYGTPTFIGEVTTGLADRAAQWGADQGLEAVEHWLITGPYGASIVTSAPTLVADLRDAMRPKPPSLAKQAKAELDDAVMRGDCVSTTDAMPFLRAALNRLAELEAQQ